MFKSRFSTTYILLGIFFILLIIVVFFENEGVDRKKAVEDQQRVFFTEHQISGVDKIVFSKMV